MNLKALYCSAIAVAFLILNAECAETVNDDGHGEHKNTLTVTGNDRKAVIEDEGSGSLDAPADQEGLANLNSESAPTLSNEDSLEDQSEDVKNKEDVQTDANESNKERIEVLGTGQPTAPIADNSEDSLLKSTTKSDEALIVAQAQKSSQEPHDAPSAVIEHASANGSSSTELTPTVNSTSSGDTQSNQEGHESQSLDKDGEKTSEGQESSADEGTTLGVTESPTSPTTGVHTDVAIVTQSVSDDTTSDTQSISDPTTPTGVVAQGSTTSGLETETTTLEEQTSMSSDTHVEITSEASPMETSTVGASTEGTTLLRKESFTSTESSDAINAISKHPDSKTDFNFEDSEAIKERTFQQSEMISCQNCPKDRRSLQCSGVLCEEVNITGITCIREDSGQQKSDQTIDSVAAAEEEPDSETMFTLPMHWACGSPEIEPNFVVKNPRVKCEGVQKAGDRFVVSSSCLLQFGLDRLNSSALQSDPVTNHGFITGTLILLVCFGLVFVAIKAVVTRQRHGTWLPAYCAMPLKARMNFRRKRQNDQDEPVDVHIDMGEEQAVLGDNREEVTYRTGK